jgi:N-acetylglucosaminyldiphosphoundecaprenol N-acetyl-beta-D-mannosaminyltransferase
MAARRDSGFAAVLDGSDLCVPDGIGVVMASRILGGAVRERVTGSDLFLGVMSRLNAGTRSCFLLGATETTLAAMAARIAVEYPLVRVSGMYAPPYAEVFPADENDRMVAAVNAAAPDVLWIGMTQPKQEKWAWLNRTRLRTRVVLPVGAVFDFYAGRTRRPGAAAQRLGVEWLVRLCREPRRLWRRNLDSPAFLWLVLLSRLSRR